MIYQFENIYSGTVSLSAAATSNQILSFGQVNELDGKAIRAIFFPSATNSLFAPDSKDNTTVIRENALGISVFVTLVDRGGDKILDRVPFALFAPPNVFGTNRFGTGICYFNRRIPVSWPDSFLTVKTTGNAPAFSIPYLVDYD